MPSGVLKKESLIPRIDGIQKDIVKLDLLGKIPFTSFAEEDNFIKAQYYLRRALEGVFNIGAHILSRFPGERITEYKSIAFKLGEVGIIEASFANNNLKNMAGYRNRLTHFYADVTPEEIYKIIKDNLEDFRIFLKFIKDFLNNLIKYNLSIE